MLFTLIDTAGLRDTNDDIEQIGVRESKRLLREADIILFLHDENDHSADSNGKNIIHLRSKADLVPEASRSPNIFYVSSQTGEGIDCCRQLLTNLARELIALPKTEEFFLLDRHRYHLERADEQVKNALHSLDSWSEEIAILELNVASQELSELLGQNIQPDILDTIFKNFCIGK